MKLLETMLMIPGKVVFTVIPILGRKRQNERSGVQAILYYIGILRLAWTI